MRGRLTAVNGDGFLLAGGSVLDVGTGEVVRRDIAVAGGRVVDAAQHTDLVSVDVTGLTIMFGLWDVHAHPGGLMYDPPAAGYFEQPAQHCVRAGANLLQAVAMGVTGVRTAGEADGIDMAWRDAATARPTRASTSTPLRPSWPTGRPRCEGR